MITINPIFIWLVRRVRESWFTQNQPIGERYLSTNGFRAFCSSIAVQLLAVYLIVYKKPLQLNRWVGAHKDRAKMQSIATKTVYLQVRFVNQSNLKGTGRVSKRLRTSFGRKAIVPADIRAFALSQANSAPAFFWRLLKSLSSKWIGVRPIIWIRTGMIHFFCICMYPV